MKKKISLSSLKVDSFITEVDQNNKIKGGTSGLPSNPNYTLNIMASVCRVYCPLK
ncbi:MAG: pinensin family lanthipeptide [Bacteroidota bacterium]